MDDRQDAADDISIDLSNPEEQQPPDLHLKSTPNNYEERVIETEFVESDTSMDDKPDSASQKKMVKEMELNEIQQFQILNRYPETGEIEKEIVELQN